jgi:hypothetical protein
MQELAGAPVPPSGRAPVRIAPTKKGHRKPKLKFGSCRSPKTYKHLKAGKYTFLVRGVNHTGADPKPVRRTFTIK